MLSQILFNTLNASYPSYYFIARFARLLFYLRNALRAAEYALHSKMCSAQLNALRAADYASHSKMCSAQRNALRAAECALHSGMYFALNVLIYEFVQEIMGLVNRNGSLKKILGISSYNAIHICSLGCIVLY